MRIHAFRALLPQADLLSNPADFFQQCKTNYRHFADQGFFQPQQEDAIYRYELERNGQVIQGIIAALDIQDYLNNHIKKHEHTLRAKEETQCRLFESQKAFLKPILATYPYYADINAWLIDMKDRYPVPCLTIREGEYDIHRLFAITDTADIARIAHYFSQEVTDVFIADGHHRCAAAAALHLRHPAKPFARIPCVLIDAHAIRIHSFHRIATLEDTSPTRLLESLSRYTSIQPHWEALPSSAGEMTFFLDNQWFVARWKEAFLHQPPDPVVLDVQLLNTFVFEKILGITDIRHSPRIAYVEGPAGIAGLKQEQAAMEPAVGFCLYPISTDQFMQGAMAHLLFPPKSTWFEPRMKSGLIVCSWK